MRAIGRRALSTPNVSAGLGVRERRGLLHHVIASLDDHVILFVIPGIVFLHFCPWVSISLIMCTGGAQRPFLHDCISATPRRIARTLLCHGDVPREQVCQRCAMHRSGGR